MPLQDICQPLGPLRVSARCTLLLAFISPFGCWVLGLAEEQERPGHEAVQDEEMLLTGLKALRFSPGKESCYPGKFPAEQIAMVSTRIQPEVSSGSPHANKKEDVCFSLRNRFSLASSALHGWLPKASPAVPARGRFLLAGEAWAWQQAGAALLRVCRTCRFLALQTRSPSYQSKGLPLCLPHRCSIPPRAPLGTLQSLSRAPLC